LKNKRLLSLLLSALLIMLTLTVNVSAESSLPFDPAKDKCIYISDSGSDSNDGSENAPVKTLKKAYGMLSNASNTSETSGGFIVIKDILTIFDSEDGVVDSTMDNSRYVLNFSSLKHKNMITLCGADEEAALRFGNTYSDKSYQLFQGVLTLGGPFTVSHLELVYSNGRVSFVSNEFIRFDDTLTTSALNNDFYLNAVGTVELFGGVVNHMFTPNANIDTTVSIGGSAIVSTLWAGMGTVTADVKLNVYDGAQINTFHVGGQAKSFSGDVNLLLAGGKIGSVSVYNSSAFTGKLYIFYSGLPSAAPNIAADSKFYFIDDSEGDTISDEFSSYEFEGVLKIKDVEAPSAKIENAHVVKTFAVKALASDGSECEFPFGSYVVNLPSEYDTSDGYRIYGYDGTKYTECELYSSGESFSFENLGSAKSYALVHMGSEAPLKPINDTVIPGGLDVIENPLVPSSPNGSGDDNTVGGNDAPAAGMDLTIIIIIAIVAVAIVCEVIIVFANKKKA